MVLSLICVIALVVAYGLWRIAALPTSRRYGWHVLWQAACVIGAVRIGALWLGAATNYGSGWVQILGYFLQMTGLPELYLVRGMRTTPLKWAIAASTLLMLSSFVWAAFLVWVANRLRRTT
jgi:hypothetical protein